MGGWSPRQPPYFWRKVLPPSHEVGLAQEGIDVEGLWAVGQGILIVGAVVVICWGLVWWDDRRRQATEPVRMVQFRLEGEDVWLFTDEGDDHPDARKSGVAAEHRQAIKQGQVWVDCPTWQGQIDRARRAFPDATFRMAYIPPVIAAKIQTRRLG